MELFTGYAGTQLYDVLRQNNVAAKTIWDMCPNTTLTEAKKLLSTKVGTEHSHGGGTAEGSGHELSFCQSF